MQNELNEIYFFLDFEKPFDSVEYNVMFKTLESESFCQTNEQFLYF